MKAKILLKIQLALLIVFPVICNAQQANYIFTSAPSPNNSPYVARDFIKLLSGFTYSGANGTFHAKIDENLLVIKNDYTSTTTQSIDLTVDKNLPFATLPGKGGVGSMGNSSYNIPINLPPGTNGMEPKLSINYMGGSGNGNLGLGWDLSGVSAITRIPQTYFKNGKNTAVNFSSDDRFALDGQKLVLKENQTAVYGSVGAEYRTESESFSKIITNQSGNFLWFEVQTIDGTIMEYGKPADINGNQTGANFCPSGSSTTFAWYVNKITDRFGNYMLFHYKNIDNECVIDYIEYTGNQSSNPVLTPYNKVQFSYEIKSDASFFYCGGYKFNNKLLLYKLSIYTENGLRDEYGFDYFFDQSLRSSKLEKIRYKANGNSINPTKIVWESNPMMGNPTQFIPLSFSSIPYESYYYPYSNDRKTVTGDFNGDGKDEILIIDGYNDPSNDTTWNARHWKLYKYVNSSSLSLISEGGWFGVPNANISGDLIVKDMNNDGKDDIYVKSVVFKSSSNDKYDVYYHLFSFINGQFELTSNNGYASYTCAVGGFPILSENRSFNIVSRSNNLDSYAEDSKPFIINNLTTNNILDYNGDGLLDFIHVKSASGSSSGSYDLVIYLNHVNGFSYNVMKSVSSNNNAFGNISVLDIDGNNSQDILFRNNTPFVEQFICPDNRWLTFKNTTIIEYNKLDNINSCNQFNILYNEDYPAIADNIYFGDYNGDGKPDMLRWESVSGKWQVLFNDGNRTFDWTYINVTGIDDYNTLAQKKYMVYDIDKDGKDDFIEVENESLLKVYLSEGTNFLKISQVTDIQLADADKIIFNISDLRGINGTCISGWNKLDKTKPELLIFRNDDRSKLVKAVYNGYNNRYQFEYKYLTEGNTIYTKGTLQAYPVLNILKPHIVVSKMSYFSVTDPTVQNDNYYTYEGLLFHATDKLYLGFQKFSEWNPNENMKLVTENEIIGNQPALMVKNSDVYNNVNGTFQLVSSTGNVNAFKEYPDGSTVLDKRRTYFYVSESTSKDYINDVKTVKGYTTTPLFDAAGTESTYVKTYGTVNSTTVEHTSINEATRQNPATYGTWYASQVTNEKTTQTLSGQLPLVNENSYEYYGNDKLHYAHKNINDDLHKNTTAYVIYNTFGELTQATISSSATNSYGVSSRTTNTTYDAKGRFVVNTQKLNYTESFEYESDYGNLTKSTDVNGLETRYEYDFLGRLKKTILPDNSWSQTETSWTNQTYQNVEMLYKVVNANSLGQTSTAYYDGLSRARLTEGYNIDNRKVQQYTHYLQNGKLEYVDGPFFFDNSSASQMTQYTYDNLNRLSRITLPNGSQKNYTYQPKTTTETFTNFVQGISKSKVTKVNSIGLAEFVTDPNGKNANYRYNSACLLTESWADIGPHINVEYYINGSKKKIIDPSLGTIEYEYDAFGQLRKQTENTKVTTAVYDDLGRVSSVTIPEGAINYEYDTRPNGFGKIAKITGWNGNKDEVYYDQLGRVSQTVQTIDGNQYSESVAYDNMGRLSQLTYPRGFTVNYNYQNGYFKGLTKDEDGSLIWEADNTDQYGNLLKYNLGNNLSTEKTYDYSFTGGLVSQIQTGAIQYNTYSYDAQGNLKTRDDILTTQQEVFSYDALDRLEKIEQSQYGFPNPDPVVIEYNDMGNILKKTNIGGYLYEDPIHFNAVTTLVNNNSINTKQNIGYTSFNKASSVNENEGQYVLDINYGSDFERRKAIFAESGQQKYTKYYAHGNYEKIINQETSEVFYNNYIFAGDGLAAIYQEKEGTVGGSMYYIHKDNLGSVEKITDESGNLFKSYSYDAWGKRRDPNSWLNTSVTDNDILFSRGYTGHEHYDLLGLMNMNGRMYDPALGRFLSPDPFMQDPSNTQNFNRYSYCLNNPLKFTDPSGFNYSGHPITQTGIRSETAGGQLSFSPHSSSFRSSWDVYDWDKVISNVDPCDVSAFVLDHYRGSGGGAIIYSGKFRMLISRAVEFIGKGYRVVFMEEPTGGRYYLHFNDKDFIAGAGSNKEGETLSEAEAMFASSFINEFGEKLLAGLSTSLPWGGCYGPDGTYNLYSESENNAVCKFMLTVAGAEIVGAFAGSLFESAAAAEEGTEAVVSGSYRLQFESGKYYVGKGLNSRMMRSIKRIESTYGDKLMEDGAEFFPASSTREAFINEYNMMKEIGFPSRWDPNTLLYNKIWSPGKIFLGE
jgi:RHS repeat-associated protein